MTDENLGEFGETKLHQAVMAGDEKAVCELIVTDSIDAVDDLGETPLHYAARHDCEKIAKALIQSGAELEIPNNSGETALYVAAENGSKNVAYQLIRAGADVNRKNPDMHRTGTALEIAAWNGHHEILVYLLRNGAVQIGSAFRIAMECIEFECADKYHYSSDVLTEAKFIENVLKYVAITREIRPYMNGIWQNQAGIPRNVELVDGVCQEVGTCHDELNVDRELLESAMEKGQVKHDIHESWSCVAKSEFVNGLIRDFVEKDK